MLERLLDAEASEYGTLTEEIELICTMTGYRRRFLIHHIGEGFFRSVELGPSYVHLATLGSFRGLRLAKDGNKEVGGKTTTSPSAAGQNHGLV
jgi:hypothetical protein